MTSWDERAGQEAQKRILGGFDFAQDVRTQMVRMAGYARFVDGARWQREQLLSDEAVERAARALDKNFNPDKYPVMTAMFRDYAATALRAAIGDDDE